MNDEGKPRTIKCPHCEGFGFVQVCRSCGQSQEAPAMPGCPEGFHHMKLSSHKGMRSDRAVY
jgi:hypothetical protein